MSKEYFDILDENGNKTGKTKLRSEVHRDGDWHKAVHIWIINDNGNILLQRRCATKDSNPNMLDISSAGHLTAGDDSLSGAIRELKEELTKIEKIGTITDTNGKLPITTVIDGYEVTIDEKGKVTIGEEVGGTITPPSTTETSPFVPEGAKKIEGTIDTGSISNSRIRYKRFY